MEKNISYEQMKEYRKLTNYCFDNYRNTKSYYSLECGVVNLVFSCEKGFKGIIENNKYEKIRMTENQLEKKN